MESLRGRATVSVGQTAVRVGLLTLLLLALDDDWTLVVFVIACGRDIVVPVVQPKPDVVEVRVLVSTPASVVVGVTERGAGGAGAAAPCENLRERRHARHHGAGGGGDQHTAGQARLAEHIVSPCYRNDVM